MAQIPQLKATAIQIGYMVPDPAAAAVGTQAFSAAANWLAFGFVPDYNNTVTKFRIYNSAITGSMAATDVTCEIYSDAAGLPNTANAISSSLTSAISVGAWTEFNTFTNSGGTAAVVAGTQYWMVIKNANATPASNFFTIRYITSNSQNLPWGILVGSGQTTANKWGYQVQTSANSGGTWTRKMGASGLRLEYTDGTFDGFPIEQVVSDTVQKAFGSNALGLKFTVPGPSGLTHNIAGVALPLGKVGTPTGQPIINLYVGNATTTPTASITANVTIAALTDDYVVGYFSTIQPIPGGSIIRLAITDTNADSSANYYRQVYQLWDSNASSTPMQPFGGTLVQTFLSSGSWTDTANRLVPFILLPDATTPYTVSGGSSGSSYVY